MKQCTRCILEEGDLGCEIDERGLCSYCAAWDNEKGILTDYHALAGTFRKRIDRVRGRYPYDALVGISGGKDSTYVLYRLAADYGLKVLAVTFDNGFMTGHARKNIEAIVARLGVEHRFIRPDWDVHRSFYRAVVGKFADPCIACAMAGYFHMTRVCHESRIPFFVHGRSPFQMFRNLRAGSGDVFIPMVRTAIEEHSVEHLRKLHAMVDGKLRELLEQVFDSRSEIERVYNEFFVDPRDFGPDLVPEHLGFFVYHPYDEEKIKQMMEQKAGYRRPEGDVLLGHGDCEIHDASSYLFERVHGVSMVTLEIAAMVRHGALTREEAGAMLGRHRWEERVPRESIDRLCARLGLKWDEIEAVTEDFRASRGKKYESH
jgi:hypothetical protein